MLKCLTARQVGEITTLSKTTVYRLLESGEMPAVRIGSRWLILPDELEKWLVAKQNVRVNDRGENVVALARKSEKGEQVR